MHYYSFATYNHLMRWILLLSQFYWWGKWGYLTCPSSCGWKVPEPGLIKPRSAPTFRLLITTLEHYEACTGWCGSVAWVLACEPKGHWFDSQSGHMPGLQARSPVGGTQQATTHWRFSLFFLLSPLSKNKQNLKKKTKKLKGNISRCLSDLRMRKIFLKITKKNHKNW